MTPRELAQALALGALMWVLIWALIMGAIQLLTGHVG